MARKWRPKNFPEMVGQAHVLRALINALDNDRLHHAYLFTGTRGVGKTTVARILAKSLNCLEGVSSNPCGVCAACQEIDEGRFVDLIEVDAASKTKVEDTRELLENVQYAPTSGRFKVYLIDEVHMLSTHSFNALLKTLEEPPEHVKFLLATTDPQKLPATVLSRCLQFNLKCLPVEQIVEHQTSILEKEGVEFEKGALIQIARAAEGSMRDSLSLLDQAIAFGGGKLQEAEVQSMLGTIAQSHVYELIKLVFASDAERLVAKIADISGFSPDYSEILAEMINVLHRISLAQVVPNAIDDTIGDKEHILNFAQQISAANLQLFYQIALIGRKDLPFAPDQRTGFEMIMLRMLAFKPFADQQLSPNTNPASGKRPQQTASNVAQGHSVPVQMGQGCNPAAAVMASLQNQQVAEKKTESEIEFPAQTESKEQSAPAVSNKPEVQIFQHSVSQDPQNNPEPAVKQEPIVAEAEQSKSSGISAVLAALKNRGAIGKASAEHRPMQQGAAPTKPEIQKSQQNNITAQQIKKPETITETTPDIAAEYEQYAQIDTPDLSVYENDIDPVDCGIVVASEIPKAKVSVQKLVYESQPASSKQQASVQENAKIQQPVQTLAAGSRWSEIISQLDVTGLVSQLAQNCTLIKQTKDEIVLKLEQTFSNLLNPANQDKLSVALNQHFGVPVRLQIDLGVNELDTPAMMQKKEEISRQKQAEQMILDDPMVKSLQAVFGAEVQAGSVQPV